MRRRSKKFGMPTLPYDKLSIMHSNGYFYSYNGKATITDKHTEVAIKSQRKSLTNEDRNKINSLYPLCFSPLSPNKDAGRDDDAISNSTSENSTSATNVTRRGRIGGGFFLLNAYSSRGVVEDTRLEAKAKDTQKNPRPRTALPRTDSLEAKNRNARGQGQGPRTQAQVFSEKNFFTGDLQNKRSSKKFWLVLELWSRGFYVQAYADDLAVLVTVADML